MWPYLLAAAVFAVLVILWWRKRQRDRSRLISFVALLREPQSLEALYIQTAARKAWNVELGVGEEGDDEDNDDGFVVGEDPSFVVRYGDRLILLNNFDAPYMEDPEEAAQDIVDLRLRSLVAQHTAWMSCDALGLEHPNDPQELRAWYRVLGSLLAELIDDNCLAIYLPDTDQIFAANAETLELLRHSDPLLAMNEEGGEVPVIDVPDDHPEMQKAVAEARRRWPEFASAFESGSAIEASVKVPITRDDVCEYIWVKVTAIEDNRIFGTLANEPVNLAGLSLDSPVQSNVGEVNDWGYFDEQEEFVGGFTVKVLMKLAQQRQKR